MFDLRKIQAEETVFVAFEDGNGIKYTDDKGEEVGISAVGPTTPKYRKAREKMQSRFADNAALPKQKQNKNILEDVTIGFLKDVAIAPVNFCIDGKDSDETLKEFLENLEWRILARQVGDKLIGETNFLPSA